MAFADWPTSDGHNMLLYPWLHDLRHTDKFVEHGHRLAGMLIGVVSIVLVVVVCVRERQLWVRAMAVGILLAVIAQGLLGGLRVVANAQLLAMVHSITGGLFFTLTFLFAVLTKPERAKLSAKASDDPGISAAGVGLGLMLPVVVLGQYVLGGMFRHLGRMLYEHAAGAAVVSLVAGTVVFLLWRSRSAVLRRAANLVAVSLLLQVGLGLGAWVTRLGFATLGWVATANSTAQNVVCSLHTVGGMFLLAASANVAVQLSRLLASGHISLAGSAFGSHAASSRTGGIA